MLKEELVMPSWPYGTPFSASFEIPELPDVLQSLSSVLVRPMGPQS